MINFTSHRLNKKPMSGVVKHKKTHSNLFLSFIPTTRRSLVSFRCQPNLLLLSLLGLHVVLRGRCLQSRANDWIERNSFHQTILDHTFGDNNAIPAMQSEVSDLSSTSLTSRGRIRFNNRAFHSVALSVFEPKLALFNTRTQPITSNPVSGADSEVPEPE